MSDSIRFNKRRRRRDFQSLGFNVFILNHKISVGGDFGVNILIKYLNFWGS
jgi:hypothetical protein